MLALPPWQSVQPSTTARLVCMVRRSVALWQEPQPALLALASSHVCVRGLGGASACAVATNSSIHSARLFIFQYVSTRLVRME